MPEISIRSGYIDRQKDVLLHRKGVVSRTEQWLTMNNGRPEALVHVDYFIGVVVGMSATPVYFSGNLENFYEQLNQSGVSDETYVDRVPPLVLPKSHKPDNAEKLMLELQERFLRYGKE